MLSKEYLVTGIFPRFGKAPRQLQLTIDKRSGIPTKTPVMLLRRHSVMHKYFRLRHGLSHPIKFYAVTECEGSRLVSISDGDKTRYYWLTSGRSQTYVVNKPSRSFEEAWVNLFESIASDKRASAKLFYKTALPFFTQPVIQEDGRGPSVFAMTLYNLAK